MWLTSVHHACTFYLNSQWFPPSGLHCMVGKRPIKGSLHPRAEKYIKNVYFITIGSTHKSSSFLPSLPILCGIQDPEVCSLFAMLHAWLSSWFPVFDQVYLLSACFFSWLPDTGFINSMDVNELNYLPRRIYLWVIFCWDLIPAASSSVRLYGNCFIFNEAFLSLELVLCTAFGSHLEPCQEIWISKILRWCQLKCFHS